MNTIENRLGLGLAAAMLALGFSASAALAAAPASMDYGKGFERLAALGLPDTATGTYARLQLMGARDGSGSALEYEVKMLGNGWVLQPPTNQPGTVVSGQVRLLTVWEPKVLAKLRRAEARTNAAHRVAPRLPPRYWQPQDSRVSGTWKPADFTNDLARVIAYIEGTNVAARSESERELLDSESSSNRRRLEQLQGPLFLLATHAWRHGRTNEANRIAAGLFAAAGDPRKVILAAVKHLADEQYQQAFDRFNGEHDWVAFQADLTGLLQRFPQGWKKRPGVALLASNVATRATAAAPELVGEGVTDADKAMARDLAALKTPPTWESFRSLWLLGRASTNAADVLERLAARKAAAIPLLAALVDDGWLLPFGRDFMQRWGGYSESWSSDGDADQKARQTYDQLDRPVSRSDIALKLLRQIVLAGDNAYEIARKPPDEIRTLALEFHRTHGSKSPIQLARLYFAEGSSEQREVASKLLLRSTDTNDLALIETQLADAAKVGQQANLLREYANVRGAAARPLVLALASELGVQTNPAVAKPAAKPNAEETASGENRRGQYERTIVKELLALVSDQSLESLLVDLGAGKDQTDATRRLIQQRLVHGDREVTLGVVLDAAIKSTNAAARVALIGYTGMLRYVNNDDDEETSCALPPRVPKPWRPTLARHQVQWTGLLADNRRVGPGAASATVADTAAEAIEALYATPPAQDSEADAIEPPDEEEGETADTEDGDDEAQVAFRAGASSHMMAYYRREQSPAMLTGMLGARGRAFVLARAKDRVGGAAEGGLPAYPKADAVKPPRRKELTAQLAEAGAAAKVIEGLTLDERLWLASALDSNTNLNALLVPLSLRIVDVTGPDGDAGAAVLASAWKGKALERKTVQALVDYVQARLKVGEPRFVAVQRQPSFDGVSIRIQSAADMGKGVTAEGVTADWPRYLAPLAKGLTPAVVGFLDGSSAIWPLVPEAAPAGTSAVGRGASEVDALLAEALADVKTDAARSGVAQQDRFWKSIDSFNVNNAAVDRTVQLMGVESAQVASESGDEDVVE